MKDRGKRELEAYINNGDCYGDPSIPDFPCKKHPASASSSSGGGICAYCLTDRLVQLVCPECGEQRLSSCSCSEEISSGQGEVGRISFLLENDKKVSKFEHKFEQKAPPNDHDFAPLKRSNSTCVVDVSSRRENPRSGFWKLGKLFRKKRGKKGIINNEENKSEIGGVSDCVGVSRSRSLCSFRGFYDSTEESGGFPVSSSAARASSVSANFHIDSAKRSCFSESEARISNFEYYDASFLGPNKNIFSLKESEFISSSDDPAFIDLKLNEVDLRPELKRGGLGMSTKEFGFRGGEEMFKNGGGSCRISVSERELRKCKKAYKVWRWFFRHQPSSRRKDEDDHGFAFKS